MLPFISLPMMVITEKYILFFKNFLSNFQHSPFILEGQSFFCVEQYFMWKKAVMFGDDEVAEKILQCTKPWDAKHLGRQVRNYDDVEWSKVRYKVMFDGNLAKYQQNPDLRRKLLDLPQDHNIVEANPNDSIWAIGLSEDDPKAQDETTWKGQNLLGKVLDDVRLELLK